MTSSGIQRGLSSRKGISSHHHHNNKNAMSSSPTSSPVRRSSNHNRGLSSRRGLSLRNSSHHNNNGNNPNGSTRHGAPQLHVGGKGAKSSSSKSPERRTTAGTAAATTAIATTIKSGTIPAPPYLGYTVSASTAGTTGATSGQQQRRSSSSDIPAEALSMESMIRGSPAANNTRRSQNQRRPGAYRESQTPIITRDGRSLSPPPQRQDKIRFSVVNRTAALSAAASFENDLNNNLRRPPLPQLDDAEMARRIQQQEQDEEFARDVQNYETLGITSSRRTTTDDNHDEELARNLQEQMQIEEQILQQQQPQQQQQGQVAMRHIQEQIQIEEQISEELQQQHHFQDASSSSFSHHQQGGDSNDDNMFNINVSRGGTITTTPASRVPGQPAFYVQQLTAASPSVLGRPGQPGGEDDDQGNGNGGGGGQEGANASTNNPSTNATTYDPSIFENMNLYSRNNNNSNNNNNHNSNQRPRQTTTDQQQKLEQERKKRRFMLCAVVIVILMIILAFIIGLVVGLNQQEEEERQSSSIPSPTITSVPTMIPSMAPTTAPTTDAPTTLAPSSSPTDAIFRVEELPDYTWARIQDDPASPQSLALQWLQQHQEQIVQVQQQQQPQAPQNSTNPNGGPDYLEGQAQNSSNTTNGTDMEDVLDLAQQQQQLELPLWRKQQLFALSTIYYALDGPDWSNTNNENNNGEDTTTSSSSWLDGTISECYWGRMASSTNHAVNTNSAETSQQRQQSSTSNCNSAGEFQRLHLYQPPKAARPKKVASFFPPEIAMLSNLIEINVTGMDDIFYNSFSDDVWPALTATGGGVQQSNSTNSSFLSKLEVLALSRNNLDGTLPSEMGILLPSSLRVLDLSNNFLEDRIPTEFALLTKLSRLDLSSNGLDGPIKPKGLPSIGSGRRPIEEVQEQDTSPSPSLTHFDISQNRFFGRIPSQIGLLSELTHLDVGSNRLSGTLPLQVARSLTNLELFAANDNQNYRGGISGPIPDDLGLSLTKLRVLNLGSCSLEGSIPSSLGLLPALQELYLNGNKLSGPIPSFWASSASSASVSINGVSGGGGDEETKDQQLFSGLRVVDFRDNPLLSGTIATDLCWMNTPACGGGAATTSNENGLEATTATQQQQEKQQQNQGTTSSFPCSLQFDCTDILCGGCEDDDEDACTCGSTRYRGQ